MSIQDQIANSLVKTQVQVNFSAPATLNSDVLGAEDTIGLTNYNLLVPNVITDIQNEVDPVAGLSFTLYTRRLNDIRKKIGNTANFLTTFNASRRPNMPIGLGAGLFQFVEQQNVGALTAQNYLITTVQPLVV